MRDRIIQWPVYIGGGWYQVTYKYNDASGREYVRKVRGKKALEDLLENLKKKPASRL